jgi:hypothetical protein
MNICLRIRIPVPGTLCDFSTEWSGSVSHVTPGIRDAYTEYKERPHYYREAPHISHGYIVYRPDNDPYFPTYIAWISDIQDMGVDAGAGAGANWDIAVTREIHDTLEDTNRTMPIIDLNDIYVFITDPTVFGNNGRANWFPARSYQIWAYRDYMYDRNRSIKKSYMSRDTFPVHYRYDEHILTNQIVTIDVANVSPNIVFNIARNENNSVYFERNDEQRSRMRICDNQYARTGYLGFYTRITMDVGMEVTPPPAGAGAGVGASPAALLSITHLPDPEEITDDDHADQCILCVKYRVNARFSPCEHQVCCGLCYSKMTKNECPVCRAEITRVMNV